VNLGGMRSSTDSCHHGCHSPQAIFFFSRPSFSATDPIRGSIELRKGVLDDELVECRSPSTRIVILTVPTATPSGLLDHLLTARFELDLQ